MLQPITHQLYFLCTQESRSAQLFTTELLIPEDNEVPAVPKFFFHTSHNILVMFKT